MKPMYRVLVANSPGNYASGAIVTFPPNDVYSYDSALDEAKKHSRANPKAEVFILVSITHLTMEPIREPIITAISPIEAIPVEAKPKS